MRLSKSYRQNTLKSKSVKKTHFIQDLKRERVKENSKFTVELQRTQIAIKESENKVLLH